jgi:predicted DCC family thiol-disulfide oxidoreductase YuxK
MATEITDNNANAPVGRIYFDAECRFCAAHRRRWGPIFERRGFVWLPLQTPGAAHRLGVTESRLREEMWLQLADGRTRSGVDAWSALMRHVWWVWPLGIMLALPGFNAGARVLYRWIARNRHCLGGACTIHSHGKASPSARRMVMLAGLAVALTAVLWSWRVATFAPREATLAPTHRHAAHVDPTTVLGLPRLHWPEPRVLRPGHILPRQSTRRWHATRAGRLWVSGALLEGADPRRLIRVRSAALPRQWLASGRARRGQRCVHLFADRLRLGGAESSDLMSLVSFHPFKPLLRAWNCLRWTCREALNRATRKGRRRNGSGRPRHRHAAFLELP